MFNPLAIWTDIALKSGTAMLEAAQAAVTLPNAPKVAILPDAPPPKSAPSQPSKSARKARKNASSRVRPRGR
jgi:hypothetical protein